ncbi:hypothetical protein K435DRAFT_858695 [Dendrothele bispora CBS 962.96]|uniref:lytic cellulose monooxygenase (C4-dehydrogenating) n=1 Tax=Dendrothele bispora (strain CBS 962.96) TaxID=1314807 RepID=A0A4S8M2G9_DENBC|nr:hypothetical protein K435DRAFT_858695 [Dendrothele bispora CBS 962.96]
MANSVYNAGPKIHYDGDSVNDDTFTRKIKMACESADPALKSIDITAGFDLTIYWEGSTSELLSQAGTGDTEGTNPWDHAIGPITDYITSCNGDLYSFSASDAGNAGWTKLATFDLDTSQSISVKGLWVMAELVEDSSEWTVNSRRVGRHEIYYDGDSVNDDTVTRKMYQASSSSYLNYWDFSVLTLSKMACESADPAPKSIDITAGSDLTIYWEGATSELLNQAGTGDTDGCMLFGVMAKLVEDSSSWTVNIPSGLKSGEYLVRHELASSQRFILPSLPEEVLNSTSPVSIQINLIDGGSGELPFDTHAGSLYETDGYLANYDVYTAGTVFEDIGPAVWDIVFGSSSSSLSSSSSSSSEVSTTLSSSSSSGATVDFAAAAVTTSTTAPTFSSCTSAAALTTTASAATEESTATITSPTSSGTISGEEQCKTRRSVPVEKRASKGHGQMKKRLARVGI